MTTPGIPDLYQGTEFWDFSLVDPDNRREVDFARRIDALTEPADQRQLIEHWRDGRIKQWLITTVLSVRYARADLFARGDYQPLQVEGDHAEQVLAFARSQGGDYLVVLVPRLASELLDEAVTPHPASTLGRHPRGAAHRHCRQHAHRRVLQRAAAPRRWAHRSGAGAGGLPRQPLVFQTSPGATAMSAEEQRIREFAYQIWESEGKPTGQEARHWEMARKLAESETRGERPPAPAAPGQQAQEVPASPPAEALVAQPAPRKPRAAKAPPKKTRAAEEAARHQTTPKAPKA